MRIGTRWIWTLSLIVMLAGCASAQLDQKSVSAASQSIVPGTPDEVGNALVEEMARRQFSLTGRGTGYLAFDRPIDNAALWPKLDGAPGHLPRARVVMTLTPVGGATRVAADIIIIAAPGTAQEHVVQASALGVDPRIDDILRDAEATVIADRGTSDPRVVFATAPISR
jgi:hypothetical protein